MSAPGEDDGAGAVYVFTRAGDAWSRRSRFQPDEGGNGFGTGIALDGASLLVSTAPSPEVFVAEVHAFQLDRATGGLEPLGRLEPEQDLGERNLFGTALAVKGSLALVGAPVADNVGKLIVFERDDGTGAWAQAGTLAAFDGQRYSRFGSAIAFDGDDVWIGAPNADEWSGSLYHFARDGERGWTRVVKSGPGGLGDGVSFGSSPAIVGLDEEIPCMENLAAGFECDNVNVISFLPINELAGGRGAMVNDIWG